jgi:hypothetical protein
LTSKLLHSLQVFPLLPASTVLCRAKNIKNQAVVNEDADQRTLLRKYERELRRLRAELTRRNQELVDKRHLLEVRTGSCPLCMEAWSFNRLSPAGCVRQCEGVCVCATMGV